MNSADFSNTPGFSSKERLQSHVFDLPVQELRRGYRSDIYFWREKRALEEHGIDPEIIMQVFQKNSGVICGIDECLAVLKLASGRYSDYKKAYKLFDRYIDLKKDSRIHFHQNRKEYLAVLSERMEIGEELDSIWIDEFPHLEILTLKDGESISPWESVMHIKGKATSFAHLETIYLGILARRTKVATNVSKVVQAAGSVPVLYFPARFDHWEVQGGDGYAAYIGGAAGVSTLAQGEWWGAKASGTVPHAMIATLGGDTVAAAKVFGESYPETNLVALVDFDNDCVNTSLDCARELGEKLWGVRLDTSEMMVDKSIFEMMGNIKPTGVTPELVLKTREKLDSEGFNNVKIIVSGGFSPEKIREFVEKKVPVDAYGIGSYLLQGKYDFTADVVVVNGKPCAKKGRVYNPNSRLGKVIY
ncbi:MAG: quinolinate phosphoribosyl transferase [Spirochaetia bacterium]|jgi:nicotinate phosphoribosyltransferase|nr:quinolinate phosphoribosyl transferase [Spirochaetia bacterium]